jgi:predicted nucleic acid-binding protein
MDDRQGIAAAVARGLEVMGTLGVLVQAARHQLLNLADAFDRLRATNFHCTEELYRRLLAAGKR